MRPTKETRKSVLFPICLYPFVFRFIREQGRNNACSIKRRRCFLWRISLRTTSEQQKYDLHDETRSEKFWSGKIVHKMRPWNSQKSGEKTSTNRITVYERNILFLNYFSKTENCLEKSTGRNGRRRGSGIVIF